MGREGRREGGPIRGLGTDHVISLPMRGLKKLHPIAHTDTQTDGHADYMTESVQLGRFTENISYDSKLGKKSLSIFTLTQGYLICSVTAL